MSTQRAAETYLRLLAESELRRAQAEETSARGTQYRRGSQRLHTAASVLATVGAVEESVAESVVSDHSAALAARSHLPAEMLLAERGGPQGWIALTRAGQAVQAGQAQGPPPAGPLTATPLWVTLRLDNGYARGEVRLMAAVSAPGHLVLTMIGFGAPVAGINRNSSFQVPLDGFSATDNTGKTCALSIDGGGGDDCWEGRLAMASGPGPLPTWLDIASGTDGPSVRADLTRQSTPAEVIAELAPAATAGERLLASAGDALLAQRTVMARVHGALLVSDLDVVREALQAAGELPEGSPAMGRLAALGRVLGFKVSGADPIGRAEAQLPEQWASVLAERGRRASRRGLVGALPVAVVLPELEGVTFALAGLRSSEELFSLQVCCVGWAPAAPPGFSRGATWDLTFSWWALDSNQRWHVGVLAGCGTSDSVSDMRLHFIPPLDDSATWLELVVTGREYRVRARFPLEWETAR